MHLFIEKITRKCTPYISKRSSNASNKCMKRYDSIEESKVILYLDENNLLGQTVSQYLTYSEIKWLNEKEVIVFCFNSIIENGFVGYMLKVGLDYASKFHELHNDYPLTSEKLEINENIF